MTVDLAALFAELAESQTDNASPAQGYSIDEITRATSMSRYAVNKLITQALANGSCEIVQRRCKTRTGYWTTKPAYVFKAEPSAITADEADAERSVRG